LSDYWLFVTDDKNWKICLKNQTWGTHDRHAGKFKQIQLGNIIIVYLKGFKLAGTVKVNKTYFYSEEKLWLNELYPHRIGFEPDNILEEPKNIRNFYYENFSEGPAGYFRTSIRKLPLNEAELFLKVSCKPVREEKTQHLLYKIAWHPGDYKGNFCGNANSTAC